MSYIGIFIREIKTLFSHAINFELVAMESSKFIGTKFTFDDVLLVPAYSEVLPSQVSTQSKFSTHISLEIPIVSAAMDTVTESQMAIGMAREGGIGVLHKNMSIDQQVKQVRKVKRYESGMIIDPITLPPTALVQTAKQKMNQYKIGGIPIINESHELLGIITNRDLRFEDDNLKSIQDLMTKDNLITVKEKTTLLEAKSILQQHRIEKLPVVDNDNKLIGLITFRDILKQSNKPKSNRDAYGRLRVAAAIGITEDSIQRVAELSEVGVDAIVIDTAHGHTSRVASLFSEVKKEFKDIDVIVGNIATTEAAKYLADLGVDGIKIGIGPGSICTTRVIAGVGYPQLSAIVSIAHELKNSNIPIIADGGVRYSGDIPKAIAAGADCVMLGSLLAGTKESPGELLIYEGRQYKSYRGMGSVEAMKSGSKDRYFQDFQTDGQKLVPEGIVGRVPYKGLLEDSIHQFVGGLRAGMGYCGTKNIQELQRHGRFVVVTQAGIKESHPHTVSITREAPNYSP